MFGRSAVVDLHCAVTEDLLGDPNWRQLEPDILLAGTDRPTPRYSRNAAIRVNDLLVTGRPPRGRR
jgi:hypothetical protein